jgi:hypothetical protein
MKKINIQMLLFFMFGYSDAQTMSHNAIVKQLALNNKKLEHFYYLSEKMEESKLQHYYLAKYYLQCDNDSMAFAEINQCNDLFFSDTNTVGYTTCYFLSKPISNSYQSLWFDKIKNYQNSIIQEMYNIYKIDTLKPKDILVKNYKYVLHNSVANYKQRAKKNPILSASMSAIVPGLGKVYSGQSRIAIGNFAANILFGFMSVESIKKLGLKHPISIINILFTSAFYGANIYGSYRDTQYFKKEHLYQLYKDAYNYYSVVYYPNLYQ